ncbi:MAG: glucuronate isomerase [Chitinispirillaceae bacterium]|nr:glucuronate isomerase [Chitinispirillaceae bacterium]
MMYLTDDFLLHSPSARRLYHGHAAPMPILDYHCHLSPQQIAQDALFKNITDVWLGGDHYKWRIMRTNGVDEECITGSASDEEKFIRWARTLSRSIRNPLFDWTHLELRRYFGIETLLSEATAGSVYAQCNEKLRDKAFSPRNLLLRMKVKTVCTTDDPVDDLSWHKHLRRENFGITVLPTWRPDKATSIDDPVAYNRYMDALEKASDLSITSCGDLLEALDKRHGYFHDFGCRSSDHAFEALTPDTCSAREMEELFSTVRRGKPVTPADAARFKTTLLLALCALNHKRGWAQQFHFGVIRNVRTALYGRLGPDNGVDCIGDMLQARQLCQFLDRMDSSGQLTKTILFNAFPGQNEILVSIMGAFQDGSVPGKLQLGPAWWFLDQKDGMRRQLEALSGLGLLSRFIGMTTDSRSFLSFPRHEYFRRILCDVLGAEMERGELPDDEAFIGSIVSDICYHNAKSYFGY